MDPTHTAQDSTSPQVGCYGFTPSRHDTIGATPAQDQASGVAVSPAQGRVYPALDGRVVSATPAPQALRAPPQNHGAEMSPSPIHPMLRKQSPTTPDEVAVEACTWVANALTQVSRYVHGGEISVKWPNGEYEQDPFSDSAVWRKVYDHCKAHVLNVLKEIIQPGNELEYSWSIKEFAGRVNGYNSQAVGAAKFYWDCRKEDDNGNLTLCFDEDAVGKKIEALARESFSKPRMPFEWPSEETCSEPSGKPSGWRDLLASCQL